MSSKFVYNGLITAGVNIIISPPQIHQPDCSQPRTNQQLFHLNKAESDLDGNIAIYWFPPVLMLIVNYY